MAKLNHPFPVGCTVAVDIAVQLRELSEKLVEGGQYVVTQNGFTDGKYYVVLDGVEGQLPIGVFYMKRAAA
jgi:hypothetical protein